MIRSGHAITGSNASAAFKERKTCVFIAEKKIAAKGPLRRKFIRHFRKFKLCRYRRLEESCHQKALK